MAEVEPWRSVKRGYEFLCLCRLEFQDNQSRLFSVNVKMFLNTCRIIENTAVRVKILL